MGEISVDARGQACPKPLVMTRKALQEIKKDDILIVLVNDPVAAENIGRYLNDNGIPCVINRRENEFHINISPSGEVRELTGENEYCPASGAPASACHFVICINSETMGHGPEELGKILMQAFVNTIKDLEAPPASIVLYNTGVLLAAKGSPVLQSLRDLENGNIPVLVCGTCVSYFRLGESIGAGRVSNMFEIMETLCRAHHVVCP